MITVTAHAIGRYRERIDCIEPAAAEELLLNAKSLAAVYTLGDGTYPIGKLNEGYMVVVNNTIVTVYKHRRLGVKRT